MRAPEQRLKICAHGFHMAAFCQCHRLSPQKRSLADSAKVFDDYILCFDDVKLAKRTTNDLVRYKSGILCYLILVIHFI